MVLSEYMRKRKDWETKLAILLDWMYVKAQGLVEDINKSQKYLLTSEQYQHKNKQKLENRNVEKKKCVDISSD